MNNTVLADVDSAKTIQGAQDFKGKDDGKYVAWGIRVPTEIPGGRQNLVSFLEFKDSRRSRLSET